MSKDRLLWRQFSYHVQSFFKVHTYSTLTGSKIGYAALPPEPFPNDLIQQEYPVWNHPNPVFCLLRDPQKSMNCYTTLRILFVTYFTSEIWNGWLVRVAFCRLDRVDRGKLGIFQFIRFSACWEILKKSMNGFSTLRYTMKSLNPSIQGGRGCGTKFIVCAP